MELTSVTICRDVKHQCQCITIPSCFCVADGSNKILLVILQCKISPVEKMFAENFFAGIYFVGAFFADRGKTAKFQKLQPAKIECHTVYNRDVMSLRHCLVRTCNNKESLCNEPTNTEWSFVLD